MTGRPFAVAMRAYKNLLTLYGTRQNYGAVTSTHGLTRGTQVVVNVLARSWDKFFVYYDKVVKERLYDYTMASYASPGWLDRAGVWPIAPGYNLNLYIGF